MPISTGGSGVVAVVESDDRVLLDPVEMVLESEPSVNDLRSEGGCFWSSVSSFEELDFRPVDGEHIDCLSFQEAVN